jgi:hypothetical protein
MKALLTVIIVLFLIQLGQAQDSIRYTWKKVISYPVSSGEVWNVDIMENFYASNEGTINKYDKEGSLMFTQSIKSLGRTKQLVPLNIMKIIHFSEEQQTLCYFDNTLTSLDDCVELIDRDIFNATIISSTSKPDQVWILDNINSKILLLSLQGLNQGQEIENLGGILSINNISQMLERTNRLYLLDREKGVYVFDLYGTLIHHKDVQKVKELDAYEKSIFLLMDDRLKIISLDEEYELEFELPVKDILEFKYMNQFFYFRTSSDVHKLTLQIEQ